MAQIIQRSAARRQMARLLARGLPPLTGALVALLVARLVVRLLAARPTNPTFQMLDLLTAPLIWPVRALDAEQPRFGAVFELSTLALLLILPLIGYLAWRLCRAYAGPTADANLDAPASDRSP